QPQPVWPPGLTIIKTEGAGEVQTPLTGKAARELQIGDRVVMRHAKAGELCERFDNIALVGHDSIEYLPTYRGEGKNCGCPHKLPGRTGDVMFALIPHVSRTRPPPPKSNR